MKNLFIITLLCLAACTKSIDRPADRNVAAHSGEIQSCDFGITRFNTVKRPSVINDEASKGRPIKNSHGNPPPVITPPPVIITPPPVIITQPPVIITPPPTNTSVILLDFDGHRVSGTRWNTNGDIVAAPANLTAVQTDEIIKRVTNDYSAFNITVTTDEAIYNAANIYKRMRVIMTESWEWYGQAGGVSFVSSFTWGDNTPCFVFSSLLNYNSKYIAEAVSHEAGHSFGLFHQASFDASGVKTSEYNPGQGSGEISWAPIMGVSYYKNLTLWHNGSNSYGATSYQNDVAIITNIVGVKSDDYSNTFSGATPITSSLDGIINNSTDIDFFSIDISSSKTISLVPFNLGVNNAGANLDLVLNIYDSQGILISVIDNSDVLSKTTFLNAGKYYLSASTTANQYATKFGMLGYYNISLL